MNKTLASTLVAAAIGSLLTSEIIKVGEKKEFSSDLHSHQEISANPVATTIRISSRELRLTRATDFT